MIEAYNISRVINKSLAGYDRKVRPNAGGPPVIVKIEFKVISFGEIKEANMVCLVTSIKANTMKSDFQTPKVEKTRRSNQPRGVWISVQ